MFTFELREKIERDQVIKPVKGAATAWKVRFPQGESAAR
jgi:hypothetical protein